MKMTKIYTKDSRIYLQEEVEEAIKREILDTELYLDILTNKLERIVWRMLDRTSKMAIMAEAFERCLEAYDCREIEEEVLRR